MVDWPRLQKLAEEDHFEVDNSVASKFIIQLFIGWTREQDYVVRNPVRASHMSVMYAAQEVY